MNWPFVTRARMEREVAAVRETAQRHAEEASARHARQLAEAAATNRRLDDRRQELVRRLDAARIGPAAKADDLQRLEDELAAARAETDAKVAAAEERGRQAVRAMTPEEWLGRPVDGASAARREPSAELRQANERCLRLADQLSVLQTAHLADTRELRDLRAKEDAS